MGPIIALFPGPAQLFLLIVAQVWKQYYAQEVQTFTSKIMIFIAYAFLQTESNLLCTQFHLSKHFSYLNTLRSQRVWISESQLLLQKLRTAVIEDASSQACIVSQTQRKLTICSCCLWELIMFSSRLYSRNMIAIVKPTENKRHFPRLPSNIFLLQVTDGMQDGKERRTWSKVLGLMSPLATKVMNYRTKKLYGLSGGFSSELSVCSSRK